MTKRNDSGICRHGDRDEDKKRLRRNLLGPYILVQLSCGQTTCVQQANTFLGSSTYFAKAPNNFGTGRFCVVGMAGRLGAFLFELGAVVTAICRHGHRSRQPPLLPSRTRYLGALAIALSLGAARKRDNVDSAIRMRCLGR